MFFLFFFCLHCFGPDRKPAISAFSYISVYVKKVEYSKNPVLTGTIFCPTSKHLSSHLCKRCWGNKNKDRVTKQWPRSQSLFRNPGVKGSNPGDSEQNFDRGQIEQRKATGNHLIHCTLSCDRPSVNGPVQTYL